MTPPRLALVTHCPLDTQEVSIPRFSHLSKSAREALTEGEQARLRYIQFRRWFDYPRATHILERLEGLMASPVARQAPCLLIEGSSNNGKSAIAKMFYDRHLPEREEGKRYSKMPIIFIRSIANPTPVGLMGHIMDLLDLPWSTPSGFLGLSKLRIKVYQILKELGVRVVIMDELETISPLTKLKQENFLTELRRLSVHAGISVVCFASGLGSRLARSEDSFAEQFPIMELPPWEMGLAWRTLISQFEAYLPFEEPSLLSSTACSRRLFWLADCRIGELADLFEWAARYAIMNRRKKITLDLIEESEWVPPQERRNRINRLPA